MFLPPSGRSLAGQVSSAAGAGAFFNGLLEALLDLDDHPTADRIHEAVVPRFPQISRTTVYRTLDFLVSAGLATRACHLGRTLRYDVRLDPHHHLLCLGCDTVIDVDAPDLSRLQLPDTTAHGFAILDYRVQIRGTCRRCREAEARR